MNEQPQTFLQTLNNFPLHILLSMVSYLDEEATHNIHCIITTSHGKKNIDISQEPFLALIEFTLFAGKYITRIDRSTYLSFYDEPAFREYEAGLVGEISQLKACAYLELDESLEKLY